MNSIHGILNYVMEEDYPALVSPIESSTRIQKKSLIKPESMGPGHEKSSFRRYCFILFFYLFLNYFFRFACRICINNRAVDQRVYRYKRDVIDHFVAKHAIGRIESIDEDMINVFVNNDNIIYYNSGKNKKKYYF